METQEIDKMKCALEHVSTAIETIDSIDWQHVKNTKCRELYCIYNQLIILEVNMEIWIEEMTREE